MNNKAKKAAHQRVCDYVRSRYDLVDVKPKAGLFNYCCYYNAVEYARTHKNTEVLEVIYIEDNEPVLHYVNRLTTSGVLLETTLGFRAKNLEYYVIRTIHTSDYKYIETEFDRSLRSWLMQFTSWADRKLFNVNRVV